MVLLATASIEVQGRLKEALKKFIFTVSTRLPDDVIEALRRASDVEVGEHAKLVYQAVFRNLELAISRSIPLCQDTGVLEFFVELGNSFPFPLELLKVIEEAVTETTVEGFLRPNVVDPATGRNTGNNLGPRIPWVETTLVPGDYADVYLYMAGGGSSRPGSARVLDPAQGLEGLIEYVVDTVVEYGIHACPPLVIGVGIGPTAEVAASLSKRALLRPVGFRSSSPRMAELEEELERLLNELGIGPQGLGGRKTVLAVHVEYAGRHPATLAVGVSTSCWALRRGHLRIFSDLTHRVLSHGGVTLG
ncbi:MAG: fumarate hydratase [Sulfolobales archaeon]